ncbi:hypothetical protein MMC22_001303 [Lobaria immixta]|nr:hypothetical protein [Lobaria immixta]
MTTPVSSDHVLFHVNEQAGRAFFWISIGLAVLTAFLQGLVTALALMTEASARWTFRFRLALLEHWWWSMVSILLIASLVTVMLSFASGNGGDAISVLALSSATFLAMVRYTLPAWQHRHYARTRWLAWTGPSRTSIKREKQKFCGDMQAWRRLIAENAQKLSQLQPTPSDDYGWRLWPVSGIGHDPADVLTFLDPNSASPVEMEKGQHPVGVYFNADENSNNVSLLWGPDQGFRRVISRAVSSMPLGLLQSNPTIVDGYEGKGLTKAMGILGRNKGLQPWRLVFRLDSAVSTHMESASTWTPRPAKVLRSFYKSTLKAQYGGLGDDYVSATVELALIMADMPHWAINRWLSERLEHQSLQQNMFLAQTALFTATEEERHAALTAHYESSYVSMILSLNYMDLRMKNKRESRTVTICRPDIFCLGVLLKARGYSEPSWWSSREVCQARHDERRHLSQELDWRFPMAKLLGLEKWPEGFEGSPSIW